MGRNDVAEQIRAAINKKHGEGAIMTASEMWVPKKYTTGSLLLDVSLSGGISANHWTEVYGPENHGKTAITLKTLAANQRLDSEFFGLWIASEHYDLDQAAALGVDTNRLHVLSTQDMAFAYDTAIDYLQQRAADFVVLDSYPALIAPQEDEKDMGDYTQAEGAKMTNKFFRKVGKAGLRDPHDPGDRPWFGLFINQPREKIGGWSPTGQPVETTPGGRGKNFAFYTRLDVKRAEWLEVGTGKSKSKVGQVIRTRAIKHKGGPPQRVASMDFFFTDCTYDNVDFNRGDYDQPKDVLTSAILMGVVTRWGSWYKYGDRQWQGLPAALTDLRAEPEFLGELEEATRKALDRPGDKRTWDEAAVESASTARTKVRRRGRSEN